MSEIFDDRLCQLGEGPLWHPERAQFFWFDIEGKRLLTRTDDGPAEWSFPGNVSAAGWVDRDTLLVASETGLHRFDIATGKSEDIAPLEADDPRTRSNDGRADPYGGFWIGTMGKTSEPGLGSIYRYYRGEVRKLYPDITVSNAICFSTDGGHACFSDTHTKQVMRVALDAEGWPTGEPEVYLDLRAEGLNPDGAVIDASGDLWLAEWGAYRISHYDKAGKRVESFSFPAAHTSCPAFGGQGLSTLFCTTAIAGTTEENRAEFPKTGMTFCVETNATGQAEHRVIL